MPDREKIVHQLEQTASFLQRFGFGGFENIQDAIAMLKEQEAVTVHDPGAYCPKCGWMLYPEDHPHHCGNCGRTVKWE